VRSPSGSIPAHIQDAITEELRKAGLLDPQAQRQLKVLVVKNNLSAGMGTGEGQIAARFTLLNGQNVVLRRNQECQQPVEQQLLRFHCDSECGQRL
jgi:hypothetical protein